MSSSNGSSSGSGSGSGAGPLSFLRSVYDVGNLDTRFTTPSSVPNRTAVEARSDLAAAKPDPRAKPALWGTPEFLVYSLLVTAVVPCMFWVAYDVSRRMQISPFLPTSFPPLCFSCRAGS